MTSNPRMTSELNTDSVTTLAKEIFGTAPLLRTKLARALFCKPSECQTALEEVIKFMILAAENQSGQMTPSARVDVAWHEFILFTKTYMRFCQNTLGRMIHHEPSDNHDMNAGQYATTLALYQQRFGNPPIAYWGGQQLASKNDSHSADGESAFCGSCESATELNMNPA